MFILDTDVVSELRKAKAGRANRGVTEWANEVPAALMFMSVISLHELEHGVLLVERRDAAQGKVLREWLDGSVLTAFADRLLPVDEQIARRAAALHVPDPVKAEREAELMLAQQNLAFANAAYLAEQRCQFDVLLDGPAAAATGLFRALSRIVMHRPIRSAGSAPDSGWSSCARHDRRS